MHVTAGEGQPGPEDELRPLSLQEEDFCAFYVLYAGNGTKAATRAQYSEASAKSQASRLLTRRNVRERIAAIRKEVAEDSKLEIRDVVLELKRMLQADAGEIPHDERGGILGLREWPVELRRAVQSFEVRELYADGENVGRLVKVRFCPKTEATDQLLRHLGGYAPEEHKHTGFASLVNALRGTAGPDIGREDPER